ncbi:MAG: hypothetical protein C0404_13995 [Verrucomicrobia bacterium]|nr:hypothetical protein [Verrucomicrobiota bacterium]
MIIRRENTPRDGFVMLELTIALLVVAVGVLALFSVFRVSHDTVARTESDIRISLFGQEVISGLRAGSDEALQNGTWELFWERMATNPSQTNISVAGSSLIGVWDTTSMVIVAGMLVTNVFTNYAYHSDAPTNIVSHALRYRLDVQPTNTTPLYPWTNRIMVTLSVWDGIFGSTNLEDGIVFYSEFSRLGEVP